MSEARPSLLLVDDEERILSALRRSLRREGYEILTAESGEHALRVLDERPVDAIVSDQRMPGMAGTQLLERASERCPGAVRILLTGWTETLPAEELTRLRIAVVINKPWDDAALKQILRSILAPVPSEIT